jgi:hypothetical protein
MGITPPSAPAISRRLPSGFRLPVYLNEQLSLSVRMRAAIEAAPYEHPKLSAVGFGVINNDSFAAQLDRAIDRSNRAKLIEARAEHVEDQ